MLTKLKEIYKSQLIEKVEEIDNNNYYYFYYPNSNELFAIEKKISTNEYNLIKSSFIEATFNFKTKGNKEIYDYLLGKKEYPFGNKKFKVLVFDKHNSNFLEIVKGYFNEVYEIVIDSLYVMFCYGNVDGDLKMLPSLINDDFGIKVKCNDGVYINKNTNGIDVFKYLTFVKRYYNYSEEYSSFMDFILFDNDAYIYEYRDLIYQLSLKRILEDAFLKDLILTYFKFDLNVLATSKALYINRNSLLNKLDYIYKETGFNLQNFSNASVLYYLVMRNNNKC